MTARRSVKALVPALLLFAVAGSTALLCHAGPSLAQDRPGLDPAPPSNSAGLLTGFQVTGLGTLVPCETDSIRVLLSGVFPNDCWSIRGIEIADLRCFAPCPPQIWVLVDTAACVRRLCGTTPVPWRREVRLAPLPSGRYDQAVVLYRRACPDTFLSEISDYHSKPFVVSPETLCGAIPSPCLITDWRDNDPSTACDAVIGPEGTARAAMRVFTPVALSALQGKLRLTDDSLRITSVVPVGPAAGMTLVWEPAANGASFVMFSGVGATIPATVAGQRPADILAVGVSVRGGRHAPSASWLLDHEVLGADAESREVRACPVMTLEVRGARICAATAQCDANGDGRTNVRDLVTMLRCLQSSCPDSSRYDCDGDHHFALGDVICCARRVLRGPSNTGGTPGPAVQSRVAFGEPQRTATGWRLPLILTGINELGAARLALRYPSDRFQIAGVEQQPGAPNWLSLFETEGAELSLGLLNLSAGSLELSLQPPGRLEVSVDLALRDGQAGGGSIEIASADFSALSGEAVEVPLPATGLRIPSGVSLSAGRPNPFSAGTLLLLSIERASDVRVSVHDLSGRRIATLLDGRFEPGQRELRWGGRDDAGREVRDGIYFVRCSGGGQESAQKVILVRAR